MYDYGLTFMEDSDYKSELFDEFEFDWGDFEITHEREEVFNLMTLQEAVNILKALKKQMPQLKKSAMKAANSLNAFIEEYEKLGESFDRFNPRN